MTAPAGPSVTVAELLVLHQQARLARRAAGQTISRAMGTYARATKLYAEWVRVTRPSQVGGRDQDPPAGGSLARLLQPRLAAAPAPPNAPSSIGEPERAAVRPLPTPLSSLGIRGELVGSLAAIRSQVEAIHRQFQLADQAGAGPGGGHLRLVRPPQWAPTSPTPPLPLPALGASRQATGAGRSDRTGGWASRRWAGPAGPPRPGCRQRRRGRLRA